MHGRFSIIGARARAASPKSTPIHTVLHKSLAAVVL